MYSGFFIYMKEKYFYNDNMFIKKIIKEVLYLLVFIMYYLFCLVRMGEDLCIFLKIRFLYGKKNLVSEFRKYIKD